MKVGILTFPNSVSYGACLQMIALQNTVCRLGHQAEIIHYHSDYMKAEKHTNKNGENPLKFALKRRIRFWVHRRLYRGFRTFEKQHIRAYPAKAFSDKRRLAQIGKRYDAVICGSDQVWCPRITGGELSYFLDFCTDSTRRVAYAPSFGEESFSEEFYGQIGPELRQFSALSVRELPGQKILTELTGREAALVADPTFLVEAASWAAMEKSHPAATGDYVLYFVVRQSESLMRRCAAFAQKQGLKMVVVGGNPLKTRRNRNPMVEYAVDIGPEQWLYLLHHARYVFTNSFHGTAFSVIFEKDFYVEYPPYTGSRLRQVMETLGLENRVIKEGEEPAEQAIDYGPVRQAFAALTAQSLEYLENALK